VKDVPELEIASGCAFNVAIFTLPLSPIGVRARGKICTHTKNKKNRANFYANLNALKKARARSDDINYLCCSQTWKKPRFQLKMPFAWLSLTCLQNYSFSFSIFFCCDDAVCTTTCFCFCFLFWPKRPLSWKAERGGASRVLFCKEPKATRKKKSIQMRHPSHFSFFFSLSNAKEEET